MALFSREPKQIRELKEELLAAKVAIGMLSKVDPARGRDFVEIANRSILDATSAAIESGDREAARQVLMEKMSPPDDVAGSKAWSSIIESALEKVDPGASPDEARASLPLSPDTRPAPPAQPAPAPGTMMDKASSPAKRHVITFDEEPASTPEPPAQQTPPSGFEPTDPADIFARTAEFSADLANSDRFTKLVNALVPVCGKEIVSHIDPTDRGGLLVPISFLYQGKFEPGAVFTLEDRAIFAWLKGSLRIKNFEAVVPYASITNVEESMSEAKATRVSLPIIEVKADQDWTLRMDNILAEGSPKVHTLMANTLLGMISFNE